MAHESQVRYSDLVLAKLRSELVLSDGFVFNNDYEGSPASGSVKIPVRDDEVTVSDYDRANGIQVTHGSTSYTTLLIDKDKAINELIDGFDAETVPDNLVADRLDSGGYSLAKQIDIDGGTVLLAGAEVMNIGSLSKDTIYDYIVEVRKELSKANVPDDGKRYLLLTPDAYAYVLKCDEFTSASELGDSVKQTGATGKIAGFLVKEWNDSTPNLAMLAGHPRFATRAMEWSVDVHVQDLSQSGKYIGACAVQGRNVYGHKVLRSAGLRAVYANSTLGAGLSKGDTAGTTVATITGGATGGTYFYKINPSARAVYGMTQTEYGGTSLTSGTTKIKAKTGDILEIVNISNDKVTGAVYLRVESEHLK